MKNLDAEYLRNLIAFNHWAEHLKTFNGVPLVGPNERAMIAAAARFIKEISEQRSKAGSASTAAKTAAAQRNAQKAGRKATTRKGQDRNCKLCGKRHRRASDPCK